MIRWIVAIIALLALSRVSAEQIEIIQLRNRTAEEIIPIIAPLIKPGEALSGTGFKLILRGSTETAAQVRRIVSQIDTGLKNLVVSVDHSGRAGVKDSRAGIGIRYSTENGGVVSGQLEQSQVYDRSNVTQQIRVMEGRPAFIRTGTALSTPGVVYPPDGDPSFGPVRREIGSGFYVVPSVNGDQVNLEINPYSETLSTAGNIDVQSAGTVVSGRVGEWIDIGGFVQSEQLKQRGILYGSQSTIDRETGIRIRVDVIE